MTDNILPRQIDRYDLLDVCQVAEALGVGVKTIRLWSASGKFPKPLRPGGRLLRWSVGQLQDWIESDCAPAWMDADQSLDE